MEAKALLQAAKQVESTKRKIAKLEHEINLLHADLGFAVDTIHKATYEDTLNLAHNIALKNNRIISLGFNRTKLLGDLNYFKEMYGLE